MATCEDCGKDYPDSEKKAGWDKCADCERKASMEKRKKRRTTWVNSLQALANGTPYIHLPIDFTRRRGWNKSDPIKIREKGDSLILKKA